MLWIFSFLGAIMPSWGQEKSAYRLMLEDDDIRMAQRPGTERLLRDYLSPSLQGEDSVTVFFMIPTACPRCESVVKPAIERLKKVRPSEKVLLVAWHPDAQAANQYVDRQHFGEDYRLIDTLGTFNEVFSTTFGTLQALLIARVAVLEGRMVTGGDFSSATEEFFRDFLSETTPLPFHVYDEAAVEYRQERRSAASTRQAGRVKYTAYELDTGNNYPGQLRNHPMLKGQDLLFLDKMCDGAFWMHQDRDGMFRMRSLLQIDSAKRDTFVTLPPPDYNAYKSLFRYMPLDAVFEAGGGIAMSYSIPHVFVQQSPRGTGLEVAFYNECTFLSYDSHAQRWASLVKFANDDLDEWMEQHFRIYPLRPGYVVMSCAKMVWPTISDEEGWGKPATDPTMDGFYDQNNPYALELELATGRITKRFGQLEDVFRRTRSGYWYSSLVADTHKGIFIYGNQEAGRLYLTDADRPEKTLRTYEVFSLGDPPQGDSTLLRQYKEEYLLAFVPYFSLTMEQVTLDDRYINCLLRTGEPGKPDPSDVYEFLRISRKSGKVVERYALPLEDDAEMLMAYGLTADDKNNRPFYLCKKQGRCYLKFITRK